MTVPQDTQSLLASRRLRLLDAVCRVLRADNAYRRNGRWYRLSLRLLEARYREAEAIGGHDFARPYDYIPF